MYQNNEIQGYSTSLQGGDFGKKEPKQLYFKELRGENNVTKTHNQQKLSSKARRNIRIVADHMQKQIENKAYIKTHPEQKAFTSFVTLSFRRILPTNEQAKDMLKNFNQRLTRKFPDHKYIWVAELQKGKYINGQKSYRLENKQSVVHFHYLTTSYLEKNQLNTIWNEVVSNYFYSKKIITKFQAIKWSNENMNFNDYYARIDRYKAGETSRQPKAPPKSEYLLMPNVVSIYNASAYMSKYMQKSGNLEGHLWGMSRNLQGFVKPIEVDFKGSNSILMTNIADNFIDIYNVNNPEHQIKAKWKDFNDCTGFWSKDGERILNFYYHFRENFIINSQGSCRPKSKKRMIRELVEI